MFSKTKEAPRARVFVYLDSLKENNADGVGEIKELKQFSTISSSLAMTGIGNATLAFENTGFKFFKGILHPKKEQLLQEEINLLTSVYDFYNKQGIGVFDKVSSFVKDTKVFAPIFATNDLIWIDYLGRDSQWYAGFSGIISSVGSEISAGSINTIKLECKSPNYLLSFYPILQALVTADANVKDLQSLLDLFQSESIEKDPNSYRANILAGKNGYEIVRYVLGAVNKMVTLSGVVTEKVSKSVVTSNTSTKFYDYKIKLSDLQFGNKFVSTKSESGKNNLMNNIIKNVKIDPRISTTQDIIKKFNPTFKDAKSKIEVGSTVKIPFKSDEPTFGKTTSSITVDYGKSLYAGRTLFDLRKLEFPTIEEQFGSGRHPSSSHWLLRPDNKTDILNLNDFFIGEDSNYDGDFQPAQPYNGFLWKAFVEPKIKKSNIFQELIKQKFGLYEVERQFAVNILNQVASMCYGHLYNDSTGALRIELPRYMDLPVLDKQNFHGEDYFLSKYSPSFMSKDSRFNAEQVVTYASVQFNTNLIRGNSPTINKMETGRSFASGYDLRKYGMREMTGQVVTLDSELGIELPEEARNKLAEGIRLRFNMGARGISYRLYQRPDLQLNRTILDLDEQLVGLITAITHNVVPQKSHQTSITCSYVRLAGEAVPDIFDELTQLWDYKKIVIQSSTDKHTGKKKKASVSQYVNSLAWRIFQE